MSTVERTRVLFLCTGNSCRSQMAEGWARHLHGGIIDVTSAGTSPQGLNPLAVRAMADVGVDISMHTSKVVESCTPETLDLVITVCGHADEHCPHYLRRSERTRVVHHGFDDPPKLAASAATDDEAMAHYARVCDEIRVFVGALPRLLETTRAQDGTAQR